MENFMSEKDAAVALVSQETGRGPRNGGFVTQLIECFHRADLMNRRRLMRAFPEFEVPFRVMTEQGAEVLESMIDSGAFDSKS